MSFQQSETTPAIPTSTCFDRVPLWVAFCLLAVAMTVNSACHGSSSSFFLQYSIHQARGTVWVTLNGFPVDDVQGHATEDQYSIRLTTSLVRGPNEVGVRARPLLTRDGGMLYVGELDVSGIVTSDSDGDFPVRNAKRLTRKRVKAAYRAWRSEVAPRWERLVAKERRWLDHGTAEEPFALDSIRAWARAHPIEVTTQFDNPSGPDFSAVFKEAAVIEGTPADSARLKDYAMKLRDLMAAKDTSALFDAFKFRYSQEYEYLNTPGSVTDDVKFLRRSVVMDSPDLDFTREEVDVRRWAGGRVWELYRRPEKALFESERAYREVYVAEIDGELKVVR